MLGAIRRASLYVEASSAAREGVKKTLERTLRWFEQGAVPERRTGIVSDDVIDPPATD